MLAPSMIRCCPTGVALIALASTAARAQPATTDPPDDAGGSGDPIRTGPVVALRIDGEGRGFAGGVGLAISRGHFEAELLFLRSDTTGVYFGGRYRLLSGFARPYGELGLSGFVYDGPAMGTKLAVGMRVAVGIELELSEHVSVHGGFGWEHFFNVAETEFETDLFVPTLGVIGRL